MKIGLYLQTSELYGHRLKFKRAVKSVRSSDIDILVFPEYSYVPFVKKYHSADLRDETQKKALEDAVLKLSRDTGKAVVVCNEDKYGLIMSVYANAYAKGNETTIKSYIKHTMTLKSAFDIENYSDYAENAFRPVIYKDHRIGLTVCYDCNHSLFSRKYVINGADIIINSTGGNVVYDKWYKYNKVRAIENMCFNFVTMGGDSSKNNNYVFGFSPSGKELQPTGLNGEYISENNMPGQIYVYNTADYDGSSEIEKSADQNETLNKNADFSIPISSFDKIADNANFLTENILVFPHEGKNVVMLMISAEDIYSPENVLKLLYADELKTITDKRYLIVNRWDKVADQEYRTKLSIVLKVRAMENYCAVILLSKNINKCFQCGKSRTAQIVRAENDQFNIDHTRTSGPEAIWRNKNGMRASWRRNAEELIRSL